MAAVPPVSLTNRQTASTLGPLGSGRELEGAQVGGRGPVDGPGHRAVFWWDSTAATWVPRREQVGVEGRGPAPRGFFVHHGFDSFELAQPVADDGGAASPGADHHGARVEELADEPGLDDPKGDR